MEKLDVNKIVTDCLIDKYNELKELTPTIKIENAPVWIIGNAVACKRIIENLITNAIRYSNDYVENCDRRKWYFYSEKYYIRIKEH